MSCCITKLVWTAAVIYERAHASAELCELTSKWLELSSTLSSSGEMPVQVNESTHTQSQSVSSVTTSKRTKRARERTVVALRGDLRDAVKVDVVRAGHGYAVQIKVDTGQVESFRRQRLRAP